MLTFPEGGDEINGGFEIYSKGVDVFIKGLVIFNEGFYKISEEFKDFNKGIYEINREFKETNKAKFRASLHTRASTFAIRTKPTLKPKMAKELSLFAPRLATFCQLETIDY